MRLTLNITYAKMECTALCVRKYDLKRTHRRIEVLKVVHEELHERSMGSQAVCGIHT